MCVAEFEKGAAIFCCNVSLPFKLWLNWGIILNTNKASSVLLHKVGAVCANEMNYLLHAFMMVDP